MKDYFDFEVAIMSVKSKNTQRYLQEVLSTYFNGEYRSCIVMLYATTFFDALEKIKIMAEEYQSEKAIQFLDQYETDRKNNKPYSSLEKDIVDYIVQSGLINDVEQKQWNHLKDYRDYCAHPVVEKDYELISPNGEQVRMHIRNMFEALFLKDAILADNKLFEEFISKIEDYYDRNGLDELKEYINSRYITKLDFNNKCKFIKKLWKFSFYMSNDECNQYRIVACRALVWIIRSDEYNLLNFIKSDISFFNGKIDFQEVTIKKDEKKISVYDNKSLALLIFLFNVPAIYKMLSIPNQTEIRVISKKNINLLLITPYLFESSEKHVEELISYLNKMNYCLFFKWANELFKQAYDRFDYSYNRLIIYYFFNCQNSKSWSPDYDYINSTYETIVSKSLPYFTEEQVAEFIINMPRIPKLSNCYKDMANLIVKVVNDRHYNIDFSSYDVDFTEYIDT